MGSGKVACVTLDLENNWNPVRDNHEYLAFKHLSEYINLIKDLGLPVSVFVVGRVLEDRGEAVERLRQTVAADFYLHSYRHDLEWRHPFEEEVDRGIAAFYSFFGHAPEGYRAPRGKIDSDELAYLERTGFGFDSSVFPSYRPGVYNNLRAPTVPYRPTESGRLLEIPMGVTFGLRVPISQSYLKLLGRPFIECIKRIPLSDPLIIDSHLQDFYHTAVHDTLVQPLRFIHKRNLGRSTELFREMIGILRSRGYKFKPISHVYRTMA